MHENPAIFSLSVLNTQREISREVLIGSPANIFLFGLLVKQPELLIAVMRILIRTIKILLR